MMKMQKENYSSIYELNVTNAESDEEKCDVSFHEDVKIKAKDINLTKINTQTNVVTIDFMTATY